MIGVTCIPIPQGRRTWKTIELIRLDGPVDFERLKPYMDGEYMSDGVATFTDFKRVDATEFPIDAKQLRQLSCMSAEPGRSGNRYVTDGRYILTGKTVVHGADPASFISDLPALGPEGYYLQSTPFARDRTLVFAYGKRIEGADASTFNVLRKPPELIGFDENHAWQVKHDELEQLDLTTVQLKQLRKDMEDARAARRARQASPNFHADPSGG